MAAEAIRAGHKLGPYELLSAIGAGGMGEVWKARDTRLDRVVAVKFSQAQFTERFEREARAIAALNHPNIAQIYDIGENYIVMEYVDGEAVRSPDNIRKLLDIAVQIADGLAAAHAAGFVHRDLKPDNILVTRDGRAKILDFGLAKLAMAGGTIEATRTIAVTNPGTVLGTAPYMSPEQARAEELDARSDQFSFGLILYELATGRRAFQRASTPETLTAIIREDPEPISATVPSPLRWTIERLLAKDPEERYASTKDLFAELRAMRARISEVSSVAVNVPSKSNRTRVVLFAAAALLAAAILLIAVAARSANPAVSRYRFTPFAVTAASESQPVWSPDARTIAYYETLNGITRIVLKAVDRNAPPVPLVQVPNLGTLSWSPDGERIYYNARSTDSIDVFFVSRAGGQPTRLIRSDPFRQDGTRYEAPAISPDGKTLAFLAIQKSGQDANRRVFFSSPPGAPPQPVGTPLPCCIAPSSLAWSPDGTRILVRLFESHRCSLWLVERSGQSTFLTELPMIQAQLSWMPDNRHVVVASGAGEGEDQGLQLLDTKTRSFRPFLPSATRITWVSVSRDGSRIAYSARNRQYELLEIPLSSAPPAPLAPSYIDQHSLAISPTRDEYAFVRLNQLVVRGRTRGDERILMSSTDFPGAVSQPRFTWLDYSHDGERLLFTCHGCEKEASLWVLPVAGGSPVRIAGSGTGGYYASWSPDGQWIAYEGGSGLKKLRVGSGEEPIQVHRENCYYPSWSPSGQWILCPGTSSLKLISPDGANTRTLGQGGGDAAWSRDGRYIYSLRSRGDRTVLDRVDAASGDAVQIRELPAGFRPSSPVAGARLSVWPDGKSVALSAGAGEADIWILDGFEPPRTFWERLWPTRSKRPRP